MRKLTFIIGYWPRRNKRTFGRRKVPFILPGLLFVFCILAFWNMSGINYESLVVGEGTNFIVSGLHNLSFSDSQLKEFLRQGMPMLKFSEAEYVSPFNLAVSLLSAVTTVDLEGPTGLLKSQLSYMEEMDVEAASIPYIDSSASPGTGELSGETVPEDGLAEGQEDSPGGKDAAGMGKEKEQQAAGPQRDNPLVGIYNTHNSENYSGEGEAEKVEGRHGGVVKVAEVLEKTLEEKYNVPVARSLQIHDYPNWNLSYTKSKETGKSLLSKHPSIQILLDIHRDAGIKERRTVEINGRKSAQVLIIVGSAKRLANPNWKKNKEFADKVNAKIEELYPGLSRGVRVQSGRYNQHLHPHALLLEIGNAKNSLDEAKVAAELMAHVISEVLKDISENKL